MTTQPEARLFRLSPEESVLAAARRATASAEIAAGEAAGDVRIEVRRRAQALPAAERADGSAANADKQRSAGEALMSDDDEDDGLPDPRGTRRSDADLAERVAAVKAEGLTARQLRIAQRIAASHGIEAESGEEAVAELRSRGIDPFHRASMRRVVAEEGARDVARPSPPASSLIARADERSVPALRDADGLPAIPPPAGRPTLPSRESLTEEKRAAEIMRIQRDIARRRQKRLFLLFLRLTAFVFLPTIIAGWYYFTQATRQYATISQFQIQQAEGTQTGGLGGLLRGTQLATNPDSVAVQSYLTSRDAMLRLDRELGFKAAFQDPSIDPLLRLPAEASNEQAYGVYKNSVKIGYDPSEGVINMEVIAPDPQLSEQFSLALIRYAEGQVDKMTSRLRDDQMEGAMANYADAERKVGESQQRIQELQQQLGVLDPIAEGSAAMQQIAALETELTNKQLELGQLQANARPNQSRVTGVQGDISRLEGMIADRRNALTEGSNVRNSLATITGELRIAEGDLQTRQTLLAAAAAQLEAARIEANKQVRYLSLSVAPVPPDEPTYPKALQNTIVAFLIFAGIYLMLSLTASILREQVSS